MIRALRRFWLSLPARILGAHVDLQREAATTLSTRVRFNDERWAAMDAELNRRGEALGDRHISKRRRRDRAKTA